MSVHTRKPRQPLHDAARINHWITAVSLILLALAGWRCSIPRCSSSPICSAAASSRAPSIRGSAWCWLQLPRAVLPLLRAQSVEPRRYGVDEEPRRGDQRQRRGPARARQVQCRPEARLLGPVGCSSSCCSAVASCMWDVYFFDYTTIEPETLSAVVHALCGDRRHPDLDRARLCRHLGKGTVSAMTRGSVTGGWAWKHHRRWLREEVAKAKTE